jgi:aminoglycoside/choline kinase family phosphotransferase
MTDELTQWTCRQLPDSPRIHLTPLRAEASFRHFYRVEADSLPVLKPLVLMTSPPQKENNEQFVTLASILLDSGIPVPEIQASSVEKGWYLMTDLGRRDLESSYGTPTQDQALEAAISTLVDLQKIEDPAIPIYRPQRFADELVIFSDWFVDRHLQQRLPDALEPVFEALVERTGAQQQCCVHRDYHCRNLLFNGGNLGVVDFQDALIGPVSYDLASLLHDCYHFFSADEIARWRDVYLARSTFAIEPASFAIDLDFSAVQRQLKAVGIFARLHLRDDKSSHLPFIPPVLTHIAELCAKHPPLKPLAEWLDALSVEQRSITA